jgi:uncharacterized protein YecA (UPF0149 family)
MSYDLCKFCGEMAFKTNGKGESICLNYAESGTCKPGKGEGPSRNKPCPCGSKKNYKNCCMKKEQKPKP